MSKASAEQIQLGRVDFDSVHEVQTAPWQVNGYHQMGGRSPAQPGLENAHFPEPKIYRAAFFAGAATFVVALAAGLIKTTPSETPLSQVTTPPAARDDNNPKKTEIVTQDKDDYVPSLFDESLPFTRDEVMPPDLREWHRMINGSEDPWSEALNSGTFR